MDRTKNPVKMGCLSKSLDNFLSMSEEQRKQKYGNNVHKYWERIIDSLEASFDDHLSAYENLPWHYAKKINFTEHYNNMMRIVIGKQWAKEGSGNRLDEIISDFHLAYEEIRNTPVYEIADDDFRRVEKWLMYLKDLRSDIAYTKELENKIEKV